MAKRCGSRHFPWRTRNTRARLAPRRLVRQAMGLMRTATMTQGQILARAARALAHILRAAVSQTAVAAAILAAAILAVAIQSHGRALIAPERDLTALEPTRTDIRTSEPTSFSTSSMMTTTASSRIDGQWQLVQAGRRCCARRTMLRVSVAAWRVPPAGAVASHVEPAWQRR